MDRRKFFKRMFGGAAAAVTLPFGFKWVKKADAKPVVGVTGVGNGGVASSGTTGPTPVAAKKCSLYVDGQDYTDSVTSLEVTQQSEYVPVDVFDSSSGYRNYMTRIRNQPTMLINATFTKHDMIEKPLPDWLDDNPHNMVLSLPDGTTFNFDAILTRWTEQDDLLAANLTFQVTGPITASMTGSELPEEDDNEEDEEDEEDPDDNYNDLFDWAEEAELDEEDV